MYTKLHSYQFIYGECSKYPLSASIHASSPLKLNYDSFADREVTHSALAGHVDKVPSLSNKYSLQLIYFSAKQ